MLQNNNTTPPLLLVLREIKPIPHVPNGGISFLQEGIENTHILMSNVLGLLEQRAKGDNVGGEAGEGLSGFGRMTLARGKRGRGEGVADIRHWRGVERILLCLMRLSIRISGVSV